MSHARRGSAGTAVIVGLLVLFVLAWLLRSALEPAAPATPAAAEQPREPHTAASLPPVLGALAQVQAQAQAPPPELHSSDSADPCTAGYEPAIPADNETVTADAITVAWAPSDAKPGANDIAFQPTAVAYLVTGLLEEAAQLTGTLRRERLTVFVYPSTSSLREHTHAPAWSHAVYDGGAVRLAVDHSAELGIQISTLRHELMHAQLHTAVGCMPAWFNEGLAMYFAGRPPVHPWLRLLRGSATADAATLQSSSFVDLSEESADVAYGLSLAMVVYLIDHTGEPGIRTTVQILRAATRQTGRLMTDLWDRLYPGDGSRAVLDSLTHKVFGVGPGPDLDAMLQAAVCCHGFRTLAGFACHGAPLVAGRTSWVDATSHDLCYATW